MEDNDWIFAKLPNWLRWIIALPVAVIASLLTPIAMSLVGSFYSFNLQSFLAKLIIMIASSVAFVSGLYFCVPKHKNKITGICSILITVLFAISIFSLALQGLLVSQESLINLISGIVCIVLTVKYLSSEDYSDE